MEWWVWFLLGLGLLAVEIVTPGGLFALFFGLAALVVGLLGMGHLLTSPPVQWLLFAVLSIASMLTLRRPLMQRLSLRPPRPGFDSVVGDVAVLSEDLTPGAVGKAELRGTIWNVRTRATRSLARGTRCTVERLDGLTLWVFPEEGVE